MQEGVYGSMGRRGRPLPSTNDDTVTLQRRARLWPHRLLVRHQKNQAVAGFGDYFASVDDDFALPTDTRHVYYISTESSFPGRLAPICMSQSVLPEVSQIL